MAAGRDLRRAARRLHRFYLALRKAWMREKKPHGFEIQDLRLGGLERRLVHAAETVERYLAGEITAIPELAEQRLHYRGMPQNEGIPVRALRWQDCYSPSVIWEGQ